MKYYSVIVVILYILIPTSAWAVDTQSVGITASVQNAVSTPAPAVTTDPVGSDVVSTTPGPTLTNDGILSCNRTNAYAQSVGAFSATQAVYVPVNEAAVTLNTGYLVYLQCTLRPLVDRLREKATADMVNRTAREYVAGNDGNPQFSQNEEQEILAKQDPAFVDSVRTMNSVMAPSVASVVSRAISVQYQQQTRHQYDDLRCDMPASNDLWGQLGAYINNPACNPMGAYNIAQQHIQRTLGSIASNYDAQLNRGQGTIPKTVVGPDGIERIVTPGSLVNAVAQQALTSGFRQTESANDVGQMVSALFTGMGAQILQNAQGLTGLAQGTNGQPSYFDQVSKNASQGVLGAVTNIALQTLVSARTVEAGYYNTLSSIAKTLTQSVVQVRTVESTCWNKIIAAACTSTSTPVTYASSTATCATQSGAVLRISTSTTASTAVIDSKIRPYADAIQTGLNGSQQSINKIDALIVSVSNTSSQTAQSLALNQFNQLVAQGALHNQQDVVALSGQVSSIKTAMSQLLGTTGTPGTLQQQWGDGVPNPADPSDPNSGWCSVNNPATISMWQSVWSQ